jgi:hypothetical protein
MVASLAIIAVLGGTLVAGAGRRQTEAVDMQEAWTAWFLGSASANPIHSADDFCGEVINGQFFMTPGVTAPTVERTCHIPASVELVSSPIGGFSNSPTDGNDDTDLFSAALGYFQGAVPSSVKARVDGVLVPKGPATCIDPFTVNLEPGSFLPEVDHKVTKDTARVAICGWFYVLEPLSVGEHAVRFVSKFTGSKRSVLVLNITVP